MKTRAKSILTTTACALSLLAAQTSAAAPVKAPANSDPEKADTLVYSATKSLIESFGELSKTANKLSETALKLLEAQESLDAKRNGQSPGKGTAPVHKSGDTTTTIKETSREAISIVEASSMPASSLTEIAEETIAISNDIAAQSTPTVRDTVYITVRDTINQSVWYLPEENREGGQYLWIPDGNISDVESVLTGKAPQLQSKPDLSEMTYWRGDSIPMALPTKRLGRYDRKLYNWLIYPKGLWHIGLTANYGELNTEDMEILTLINDIDLKGKIYSIKPSVSYFLRNNLCVGMRLAFTKGDMAVNSFKVDIDEDMSFDLHDIKYTSDSYSAAVFLQQYFGLSRRGRFAVFNEAEVSIGTGSSHFIRPFDGNIRDTRTKTQTFNINYSPGVSIMMMKNAAFNLSFGIFGFHLKDEKQWENGEESGSRFTSGINFRFNLFNINFGVSIII
ncbi:MAG: hypothetical protein K2L11_02510 [Muribaculaceae bacterium]|nr:hypothetical protein [Muribaculaceae bacterium]